MNTEWRIIQRRGQLRIYLMNEKDFEIKFKLSVLNLILLLEDVGKACKTMSISPTTAYRWINLWTEVGKDGLKSEQGKGGGRPKKMTEEQIRELEKILRKEKEWWLTKEVIKVIVDGVVAGRVQMDAGPVIRFIVAAQRVVAGRVLQNKLLANIYVLIISAAINNNRVTIIRVIYSILNPCIIRTATCAYCYCPCYTDRRLRNIPRRCFLQ